LTDAEIEQAAHSDLTAKLFQPYELLQFKRQQKAKQTDM